MNTLVLKVCSVPCVDAGRAIYGLGDLPDDGVYKAMMHLQHQKSGAEFLPLNQHRIVSIATVQIDGEEVISRSLGNETSTEADLLTELAQLLITSPDVIMWNGGQFDIPVLAYRFLQHGIACPEFWERDSFDESSLQTVDLVQIFSAYSGNASASFAEMVKVLGLAGDMGSHSLDVLEEFQNSKIARIRQTNEIDALNTYLIYLKYLKTSGELSADGYQTQTAQLRQQMSQSSQNYHQQFAESCWPKQ